MGFEDEPQAPQQPPCPHCKGTGFIKKRLPMEHPDFGRVTVCECAFRETEQERTSRLERYGQLGLLRRISFASTMPKGRSPDPTHQQRFIEALSFAKAYAEAPEGWLVLLGRSGAGKTHIAAAVANRLIERGQPVLFIAVPDLLDHLRAAYQPDAEEPYDRLFEQVRSAPVLVLDDLGAQAPTAWAAEKLYQIVSHRFNAQLPTVFTCALSLEELEERLRTRLSDPTFSVVCQLEEVGVSGRAGQVDTLSLPLMRQMTFATFNPEPPLPDPRVRTNLREAFATAHAHADNPDGWLVLLGETGAGKTHLAAAIAHRWRESGRAVEFVVVPDLLEELRAAIRDDEQGSFRRLDQIRTVPHLVLDDLGVHSATPWAQEKLFQILNYRYNSRLPTVITIGRPLEELPDAWVSRMHDVKVSDLFRVEAPDYRGLRRTERRETSRTQGRRR